MHALVLALALFAQDAPAGAELPPLPTGAPADDYQFVGWCYGALRGYIEMHDEVMPEVTRIETAFRPPGRKLEDDLAAYDKLMTQGRKDLTRFQSAITAAEKASLQPINTAGAQAVRRGRAIWNAAPEVTTRRKAQEWMSWTLPARCGVVADQLEARAKLQGAAFKVNIEPEAAAPTPEASPAPAAPAPDAALPETPAEQP